MSYTEQIAIFVLPHPLPWHNELNASDANADGSVSPLDALVIINYLNEFGSGRLPVPPPTSIVFYFDTNGDGSASPVDVLIVINLLNARVPTGEGEWPLRQAVFPATPFIHARTASVHPMDRVLSHGSTFANPFPFSLERGSPNDRPHAFTTERAMNLARIDLEELVHEFRDFRFPSPLEEIFADWQSIDSSSHKTAVTV